MIKLNFKTGTAFIGHNGITCIGRALSLKTSLKVNIWNDSLEVVCQNCDPWEMGVMIKFKLYQMATWMHFLDYTKGREGKTGRGGLTELRKYNLEFRVTKVVGMRAGDISDRGYGEKELKHLHGGTWILWCQKLRYIFKVCDPARSGKIHLLRKIYWLSVC